MDYFDINCMGKAETCPGTTLPTAFKIAHSKFVTDVNGQSLVVGMATGSVDDCLQAYVVPCTTTLSI